MKYAILILTIVCVGLFFLWRSESNARAKEASVSVLNTKSLLAKIKFTRDSAGAEVQLYKVESISAQQFIGAQLKEVEQLKYDLSLVGRKLKNVTSHTVASANTRDTVFVALGDTIKCDDTGDCNIAINYEPDTFFSLKGIASFSSYNGGHIFNGINGRYQIKESISFTHLLTKRFLRPSTVELVVHVDNPKTEITSVKNYSVDIPTPWYKKPYIYTIIGVGAGVLVMHYLN